MARQIIKKGNHSVRLQDRFWGVYRNRNQEIQVRLWGPGLVYDIGDDQDDLNKLEGVAFNLYRPHGQTTMTAWNYDPKRGAIRFVPWYGHNQEETKGYERVGSVPGWADIKGAIYLDIVDDAVEVIIRRYFKGKSVLTTLSSLDGKTVTSAQNTFRRPGRRHTRINLYHGGNMPAQGDLYCSKLYRRI